MSDRLDEKLRSEILRSGATFDADFVFGPEIGSETIQSEQIMRALRVTARLDSLDDKQRERVLDILSRAEIERTQHAEARDADSPELAAAHRSAAEGCFILCEALNDR